MARSGSPLSVFRTAMPYDPALTFLSHQSAARAELVDDLDNTQHEAVDAITYLQDGNSFTAVVIARPAAGPPDARPWESRDALADDLLDLYAA